MHIIRPIRATDLNQFIDLVFLSEVGVTSLPKDKDKLGRKIENSLKVFSAPPEERSNSTYLFVMEDLEKNQIVGVCGIRGMTGGPFSPYYFAIDSENRVPGPYRPTEMKTLTPVHHEDGPSEICSLYLHAEKRGGGWGRLLSFSRFLFIADHLNRFTDTIIAEMRGLLEGSGSNAFWDAIGRHFYNRPLTEVLYTYSLKADFVSEILPSHPIYVDLLPPEAQAEIGTVHKHTLPALNLLLEQGFHPTNEVDIIDGGPKIEAVIKELKVVKESLVCTVDCLVDHVKETTKVLISNTSLDFRALQTDLELPEDKKITLSRTVAQALQVAIGDTIRYYKL